MLEFGFGDGIPPDKVKDAIQKLISKYGITKMYFRVDESGLVHVYPEFLMLKRDAEPTRDPIKNVNQIYFFVANLAFDIDPKDGKVKRLIQIESRRNEHKSDKEILEAVHKEKPEWANLSFNALKGILDRIRKNPDSWKREKKLPEQKKSKTKK